MGRPFQGRYKAFHVEPGHALAQVAHYIHLNPLSIGSVTSDTLAEYRWSSLHRFVAGPRPAWLLGNTVVDESGGLEVTAAGWRSYLEYLALRATEAPEERERKFAALCRGWAIGSSQFQEQLRVKLEQQLGSPQRFAFLGAMLPPCSRHAPSSGNTSSTRSPKPPRVIGGMCLPRAVPVRRSSA